MAKEDDKSDDSESAANNCDDADDPQSFRSIALSYLNAMMSSKDDKIKISTVIEVSVDPGRIWPDLRDIICNDSISNPRHEMRRLRIRYGRRRPKQRRKLLREFRRFKKMVILQNDRAN